jgi:hypothetical protein
VESNQHQIKSGKIRYISMTSAGRPIRLLREDLALVHGWEEDTVEQGGRRFPVRNLYLEVVGKRNGLWQIVIRQIVIWQIVASQ